MTHPASPQTSPAQRLADTIIEKRDLQPPIPIDDLVQEIADIVPADLREIGVDAILHGLHGDSRPKVLIESESRPSRRRFTLAHEYGHLSIAWHQGTLSCAVDGTQTLTSPGETPLQLFPYEREADEFASRLLIPTRYLAQFDPEDPNELIHAVEKTEVSAEAAIYGLASHLPPGYTFFLLDLYRKQVRAVARSTGTLNLQVHRNQAFDRNYVSQFFAASGETDYTGRHIYWGRHKASMDLTSSSPDWKPILTEILLDAGYDATPSREAWRSVNGIAAWSHSAVGHENIELLAVTIKQAFMRNEDHHHLAQHRRFDEFASARALAFAAK